MRNRRPYDPHLKQRARDLRNQSTPAEALLWRHLHRRQILGYDFHRQTPIAHWIVDFFCPALDLAVEIDGESHDLKGAQDEERQRRLEALGVRFVRFPERYVIEETEGAVRYLTEWIRDHGGRP